MLPELFGRFWLLEKVGQGGMAEVYRAAIGPEPETYAFDFAVKRMRKDLVGNAELREMFRIEEYISTQLAHPMLIRVYEAGEQDGTPYLAMEFMRGIELEKLLDLLAARRLAFPKDLAVYVALQLLSVLHYLHRATTAAGRPLELVHRDITPSNIYLTGEGDLKVGDFGVARVAVLEPHEHRAMFKGKIAYAPPEAFRGQPVTPSYDLWSVGVVLFEMVTGQSAYGDISEEELIKRGPDLRGPDLSSIEASDPELAAVLKAFLHAKPPKRPQDAAQAYRELKRYAKAKGLLLAKDNLGRFVRAMVDLPAAPSAWRDRLTDTLSKDAMLDILGTELDRARRYGRVFSLLRINVDDFSEVNRVVGVEGGDRVLRWLVDSVLKKAGMRSSDFLGRDIGDTFTVLLPETGKAGAVVAAERIRKVCAEANISASFARLSKLTVSIGVASYPEHGRTVGALVQAADVVALLAKEQGKNRVLAADDEFEVLKERVASGLGSEDDQARFAALQERNATLREREPK